MKVSINKDTGLIIESQSHATNEALLENARSAGFSNIEIRDISATECDSMLQQRDAATQSYESKCAAVRAQRDVLVTALAWRYERHAREQRLGLQPSDDLIALDTYVQALADVPMQRNFPQRIDWPVMP